MTLLKITSDSVVYPSSFISLTQLKPKLLGIETLSVEGRKDDHNQILLFLGR